MVDTKIFEEELKKAQTIEELKQKYEALSRQIDGDAKAVEKLYRAYKKREFELKLQEYRRLKEELAQKKKSIKKEKADVKVTIVKKWINSRVLSAEHYVALLQQNRDGLQLLFLRKAKLVENQGYLMLEVRKLKKVWVLVSEPLLLEKQSLFRKKFVAVHFVLPNYPYTLDLKMSDNLKELTLKSINAPQILHSVIKTRFFEALARAGSGVDYTMLIIGAIMGIGIGAAIGLGVANANLAHLFVHTAHVVTNTTTTGVTK